MTPPRFAPTRRYAGALYASLADMLEGDDQAQRETAALRAPIRTRRAV